MKNEKKYYISAWLITVAVFHVIMFLIPSEFLSRQENRFWVIYGGILISLIGQAICSLIYINKQTKKERFLYLPVIIIGYIALLVMLLLTFQVIALSVLPDWFTVLVAILVSGYYLLAIIRTMAAADMIIDIDKKVGEKTEFIKLLSAKANALVQVASIEIKPLAKKVQESLRYSDPMSCDEVAIIEMNIEKEFENFTNAVKENNKDTTEKLVNAICGLIKERNELCKQLKK